MKAKLATRLHQSPFIDRTKIAATLMVMKALLTPKHSALRHPA
jgi:hypothetical protein